MSKQPHTSFDKHSESKFKTIMRERIGIQSLFVLPNIFFLRRAKVINLCLSITPHIQPHSCSLIRMLIL